MTLRNTADAGARPWASGRARSVRIRNVDNWLAQNWYLVIPWITGIGAWLVSKQRQTEQPFRARVLFFLLGCLIVLAIDLAPPR